MELLPGQDQTFTKPRWQASSRGGSGPSLALIFVHSPLYFWGPWGQAHGAHSHLLLSAQHRPPHHAPCKEWRGEGHGSHFIGKECNWSSEKINTTKNNSRQLRRLREALGKFLKEDQRRVCCPYWALA